MAGMWIFFFIYLRGAIAFPQYVGDFTSLHFVQLNDSSQITVALFSAKQAIDITIVCKKNTH